MGICIYCYAVVIFGVLLNILDWRVHDLSYCFVICSELTNDRKLPCMLHIHFRNGTIRRQQCERGTTTTTTHKKRTNKSI